MPTNCRRPKTGCTCWVRRSRASSGRATQLHRHGPLCAARRRAGRGQAPGPAAPQLPGLQHAARLRPDRRWACRRSAAWVPPTARTPRPCPSTTTPCAGPVSRPVLRGLALTRDDLVRRAVIMALMCQGRVEFESISLAHLVRFEDYFAARDRRPAADGRCGLGRGSTPTTSRSPPAAGSSSAACGHDLRPHLQADQTRERFSRIV
jgi:hypothetical protein